MKAVYMKADFIVADFIYLLILPYNCCILKCGTSEFDVPPMTVKNQCTVWYSDLHWFGQFLNP